MKLKKYMIKCLTEYGNFIASANIDPESLKKEGRKLGYIVDVMPRQCKSEAFCARPIIRKYFLVQATKKV